MACPAAGGSRAQLAASRARGELLKGFLDQGGVVGVLGVAEFPVRVPQHPLDVGLQGRDEAIARHFSGGLFDAGPYPRHQFGGRRLRVFATGDRRPALLEAVAQVVVPVVRRSLKVGGRRVVGYSVRVTGLSADESLALQEKGIGGKRRMGCGLFRPTRGP